MRDLLSGITNDNATEVRQRLRNLGLLGPAATTAEDASAGDAPAPGSADVGEGATRAVKRARMEDSTTSMLHEMVSTMGKVVAALAKVAVPDAQVPLVGNVRPHCLSAPTLKPLPSWAANLRDERRVLKWDSE